MKFGSVCSGIEAASVAWEPLGWDAAWFSEIEPFPCAVLSHHYPSVPNHGDMTLLPDRILSQEVLAPDIFCGGTPCQAFSVAGLRRSLDDDRGNLSLTFCEIADAIDSVRSVRGEPACIVFWENVPGVLNTPDNAFGCFLAGLAGEDDPLIPSGKKWTNAGCVFGPKRAVAWRVTDAQYFGVAQRRRRVFVVASARDGFDPTKILFEFDSLRRDTAPSREAGQKPAPTVVQGPPYSRTGNERVECEAIVAQFLTTGTGQRYDFETETILPIALAENTIGRQPQNGGNGDGFTEGGPMYTLNATGVHGIAQPMGIDYEYNAHALDQPTGPLLKGSPSGGGHPLPAIATAMAVRRLTPTECCRLQGFPDDYLSQLSWRGKNPPPDGPMYKALGNSWAVPNVRWIGERIARELSK